MTEISPPEFSVIKRVSELGSSSDSGSLSANEQECAALAQRFDLRAIEKLDAEYVLKLKGDRVNFSGNISAQLTQICALSGQDLPVTVEEEFKIIFVEPTTPSPDEQEVELTADDCDVMEFDGKKIDIGEAVAQTLYLALDPYARAPDAEEVARKKGLKSAEEVGPFSALAALKDKLG